ncbi:hypothetical protein PGB90_006434 [Kerria lacca]
MNIWKNFVKPVVVGISITVTFIDKIGYVARVDGKSMQPYFNPNGVTDYVYLSHWTIRHFEIHRGDIISFISPKNPNHRIIKRVIGISGDTIRSFKTDEIVNIPNGYCWVEGDHIGNSLDSNHFGPLSLGLITAKATFVVWPPSRWQRIKTELRYERLPLNLLPLK